MLSEIFSGIIDGALQAAFDFISSIMEKRSLVKQGQAQQAAAETAKAAQAQANMAQAEADAPKTPDQALDRLRNGSA